MQAEPGTVLVVDDNAENRALARATLEDEGFTVQLAMSGDEALAAFERAPADCVLLDIRMPGMDGIEVCRRLRALPYGGDVPILFLTAQRDVDTFRPISLAELLREVEDAMHPRAREAQVTLASSTIGAALLADRDLLLRTIENLVDNAIRYAPEHTAISMTAEADAGGVELRVADAGPGVPPALRARVFDRFAQAEEGRARTGRGLGLAFCKLAVEAHGGRIWVEDAMPGAVFCLRISHPHA